MNARELTARPNLEQFHEQAMDLVKIYQSGDSEAIRRIKDLYPGSSKVSENQLRVAVEQRIHRDHPNVRDQSATFSLGDAQLSIAREFGFESWSRFAEFIEALKGENSSVTKFELAVDMIITGDVAALESLLRENPKLIHERSTRMHCATLLHYLSANGVEDYRQKTPKNAVEVAQILLKAGAGVDATANTYSGDKYQTTMNLLVSSCHAAKAGVQAALVETLLDYGAAINGLENDGSPLITALAFHYRDAAEALARRGARVDNILAAAGLGREDLVRSFVSDDGILKPDVPFVTVSWLCLARDPKVHLEWALIWAAALGRTSVVDFLSQTRVDLGAKDNQGMTALHWASWYGRMDVIDLLLARMAPLELENGYGGTVLDCTVYASVEGGLAVDYVPVVERLIAAGARMETVGCPSGNKRVDEVLRRHGAKS